MPPINPTSENRAASRKPSLLPYVWLFLIAATVRLSIAYLFFGSIDVVNDTLHSTCLFDGVPLDPPVPYLPGVQLLIWLGGQLALHTGLPVAFCYKLFPCLFDSLIAVLIAVSPSGGSRSLRLGYLYAFAPVAMIVMALHGQWDSVFLYFLILSFFLLRFETRWGYVLAGAAFVMSVVAKPVAVPLVPFLFPAPWLLFGRRSDRTARAHALTLILSMAVTTAAYRLLLAAIHTPLDLGDLRHIFTYAQHGVQLMGLRMFAGFDLPRVVGLLSFLALLPAYWLGRVSRERAILLFFAFVVGVCGTSPQYLSWIVPFAILSGDLAFNALYNFVGGIVLLLYYQTPGVGGRNVENLATLAPLRHFAWLAPSLTNLQAKHLGVFFGGNLIIPSIAIVFFTVAVLRIARRDDSAVPAAGMMTPLQRRAVGGSLLFVVFLAGATCIWAATQQTVSGQEFTRHVRARIVAEYWCVRFLEVDRLEPPVWVLPSFVAPIAARPVNVFTVGVGWILIWTTAACAIASRAGQAKRG